ncbi:hypothetical protein DB29_00025 [Shouchella clausii]|nr:hypothetical protein DB29_00025 [Shouchella clausii]
MLLVLVQLAFSVFLSIVERYFFQASSIADKEEHWDNSPLLLMQVGHYAL